jgi:hypothetical protein
MEPLLVQMSEALMIRVNYELSLQEIVTPLVDGH